jgi:hypothetical protein
MNTRSELIQAVEDFQSGRFGQTNPEPTQAAREPER